MSTRPTRSRRSFPRLRVALAVAIAALLLSSSSKGQSPTAQDEGALGTWQLLLKLQTTASAMHTTAHPDDEHGGVLAMLSRRDGARVSLLTLTRGESGDNALGPQLFDALGLLRTDELRIADRYYGVDDQYFTSVIDYGFSKRLDEALSKWGEENVLRDVVRIIRTDRPYVIISRFQGTARDGHGNHEAAGTITQRAFTAAGDPAAFPEQAREGLRPWQPLKLYIGGVRENEDWTLRVDPGEFSPWLGASYGAFARLGLSFQRSQNSGRYDPAAAVPPAYYKRAGSSPASNARETGFFDGIDTSIGGVYRALRQPEPPGMPPLLEAVEAAAGEALARFTVRDPAATVPALVRGLTAARAAAAQAGDADVRFILDRKVQQFQQAITTALGLQVSAIAGPADAADASAPFAAPVPGQSFEIRARVTNRSALPITPAEIVLVTDRGWRVTKRDEPRVPPGANASATERFAVTLAPDVPLSSKPYFTRSSIQEARYTTTEPTEFGRPAAHPPATVLVRYTVEGVAVETSRVVQRRESRLPYGDVLRELRVVPALSLTVSPAHAVVPLGASRSEVAITVDLVNNQEGGIEGALSLALPATWHAAPPSQPFAFGRAGERGTYTFMVTIPALADRAYTIEALATAGGRRYAEGYELIDQRDLELSYLYRPASAEVRGVPLRAAPGLKIGYVMGIGDQVPAGIGQLGYPVTLLDAAALAAGDLARFDTIVTGTRAYAVREDLKTSGRRLLEYVKQGGNLVVLYNTDELVPNQFAPFPGVLDARAEEVSEEDSPVRILAPAAQVFRWPNRITLADFDGWVEQRGSKFWATWDPAYTPMLETFDTGQPPQQGGWLQASFGKGTYTYCAYAFHRQLPYGVPGAYRLLANLLALGKQPSR